MVFCCYRITMGLLGKQNGFYANGSVNGSINNGYLATNLPAEKDFVIPADNIKVGSTYKVDTSQSTEKENDSEACADGKAVPRYTLRNTLLGCFCTTLAAFFLALGQGCIQVDWLSLCCYGPLSLSMHISYCYSNFKMVLFCFLTEEFFCLIMIQFLATGGRCERLPTGCNENVFPGSNGRIILCVQTKTTDNSPSQVDLDICVLILW